MSVDVHPTERARTLLEMSAGGLLAIDDLAEPFDQPGQPEGRLSSQLNCGDLGRICLAVTPERGRRLVTPRTLGRCTIWVLQSVSDPASGSDSALEVIRLLRSLPPRVDRQLSRGVAYPFCFRDSEVEAMLTSTPGASNRVLACRRALLDEILSISAEVSMATVEAVAAGRQQ
ncbi:MAG TPA: hypothetical protein VGS28_02415 [Candidatus Saccharimonadales bacterium]|nr:hypothetical protein [Candidatus Saccharimonadales bacterium]